MATRAQKLLVTLAAMALSSTAQAAADLHSMIHDDRAFGSFDKGDPGINMQDASNLGFEWVRVYIFWGDIAPGDPDSIVMPGVDFSNVNNWRNLSTYDTEV